MVEASMQELLEAGVHFGHQTQKWDPRMKPFIFGERRGIHIIDLEKTVPLFARACEFIEEAVASGGDVLFVGNKRQAQPVIEAQAKRCQMHYVNNRWLGGTLTNFKTIKASIDRLKDFETKMKNGIFDALTKKEKRQIEREIEKLSKALGGIKEMASLPSVLFIIDPNKEQIAQKEANRLGIPVVAVTDTNCNPEGIDFIIPGNDDAIKAIQIFCRHIAEACLSGLEKRQDRIRAEVEAEKEREEKAQASRVEEVIPEQSRAFVSRAIKEEVVEVDEAQGSARVKPAAEKAEPESSEEEISGKEASESEASTESSESSESKND